MNLSQLLAGAAQIAPTASAARDLRRLAAVAAERRDAARLANVQRYGTEQERRTYAALTILHASMIPESDAYTDAACDLIGDAAASLADGIEERALHAADDAETAEADRRHGENAA